MWRIAIAACLLSGAAAAQEHVIGLSEGQLIGCAGIPVQSMDAGDTRYFQYSSARRGGGGVFHNFGNGVVVFNQGADAVCDATVTLRRGVVVDVVTRNSGPLITRAVLCKRLFAACE